MVDTSLNKTALSATLHCLTGCAIGEVSGMILGTAFGWHDGVTIIVSVTLAFLFGYALSLLPLIKAGLTLAAAAPVVLAADTLSIFTMEVVDNAVMILIPGAMGKGLDNPLFWLTLAFALFVAFWAAFPVNRWLLMRGRGHALTHRFHHPDKDEPHGHR